MNYKVYVRGHGGEESQVFPPARNLNIGLITVGRMGCTMEGVVADQIIFNNYDIGWIQRNIDNQNIIYWTHEQRNNWYQNRILEYSSNPPAVRMTLYESISVNLILEGADSIGKCGVCYYNPLDNQLHWIINLADKQTITLSDILLKLGEMLQNPDDTVELYWTACMSAQYWTGKDRAISFNPGPH